MLCLYTLLFLFIGLVSYGFIDPNLSLSSLPLVNAYIKPLFYIVYQQRQITSGIFLIVLLLLFFLFKKIFLQSQKVFPTIQTFGKWLIPLIFILTLSYPMLSYDLFNYMTTAKVAYTHRENPYVVMPIEIPNDTNLAFTRAANKLALYGPTWILLTWIPHVLGGGNVWQTIIAFKLFNALWYVGFCYMLWRVTKNIKNVIFFALNPLVLIETLISGHNDIIMMILACAGLLLWQKKERVSRFFGIFIYILSVFIKGATIILIPLLFFRQLTKDRLMLFASCLLLFVFLVMAPIREELYSWYAIWFISIAAFLPYPKYAWFWQFSIALSLGLELRHIPYMAMGYYEGPGPVLRTLLTIGPVAVWGGWVLGRKAIGYKVCKARLDSRQREAGS
jgi:hypothetical protein